MQIPLKEQTEFLGVTQVKKLRWKKHIIKKKTKLKLELNLLTAMNKFSIRNR